MDPAFLVIGIGNTLRRDDGAGWLFARALVDALCGAAVKAELLLQHQLTPEMAELVAEHAAAQVVFVDASAACTEVTLTVLTGEGSTVPASHHLAPDTILAIARRLYGTETAGWLVHCPACDFNHGDGLSNLAASSMNLAVAIATELLARTSPR